MNDVERLLDNTFPLVEDLLKNYGEFFPIASAIKIDDTIAQVGTYDGNDKPLSNKVISDLKNAFKAKVKDYNAIAIFYDVKVVNPNTKLKTDAVAVFAETKNEDTAYVFYYAYSLTDNKQLIFSDSWKSKNGKEIFND
jgi:hypothetical protein